MLLLTIASVAVWARQALSFVLKRGIGHGTPAQGRAAEPLRKRGRRARTALTGGAAGSLIGGAAGPVIEEEEPRRLNSCLARNGRRSCRATGARRP